MAASRDRLYAVDTITAWNQHSAPAQTKAVLNCRAQCGCWSSTTAWRSARWCYRCSEPSCMMAPPIAAEPKVTTKPNDS